MKLTLPAVTALVAGLSVSVSSLALPPVMDFVPSGAMVSITIPKLSGFEKDVTNLTTMMGLPGQGMGLDTILQMMGIEKGINLDGALCICIFPPAEGSEEPGIVVLVPTGEYKELVGNFGVEAKEAGVDTMMIQGDEVFARNIGAGFAAMGNDKARIDAFTGKGGNAAAHKAMLGTRAEALCDSSDFVIVINTAVAKPLVEKAVAAQMDRFENGEMPANLPPGAAEMGPKMVEAVFANTNAIVAGFDASSAGVSLDLAFACKPEGEFGKYLSAPGKSSDMLTKLPSGPYLVAAAVDTSSPDHKALARAIIGMMPKEQLGDNAAQVEQMVAMIDKVDGQAAVIGFAPGGLSTGLFANTVNYAMTKDSAAVTGMAKSQIAALTKADAGSGKFEEGAVEVSGQKVDSYEMKFKPNDEMPQMGQVMSSLFGPTGGPNGYMARVDGGVITTYSKNSKLMAEAMKAVKGENSLNKDGPTAAVSAKLPKGRIAELYIGPKAVFDTVKPFAGMALPQLGQLEIPNNLPPIGLGLSPGSSTLQASIFLPAPLLKWLSETAQQFGPGAQPQNGDGGQPAF